MNEKNYKDALYTCNKCGFCLSSCPVYKQTMDETFSARGMLTLAEAASNHKIDYSNFLSERLGGCLKCLSCAENCPGGLKPYDLIQQTKETFVGKNGLPFSRWLFCNSLVKNQWLMGKALNWGKSFGFFKGNMPRAKKSFYKLVPEIVKVTNPKANIGFFVGCALNLYYPQIALATVKLLKEANYQVTIPKAQKCCALPVLSFGDTEAAKKLILENMKAFKDVDVIVTACASCGLMLKKESARLGVSTAFRNKVKDITEFIVENKIQANLTTKKASVDKNIKVTYHDPCHLNRGQNITKEPRQILNNIDGVKLIEVENAGECCGGGGTFRLFNADLAQKIAKDKLRAVFESGAQILATSCPGCIMQFNDILQRKEKPIVVKHVVELMSS